MRISGQAVKRQGRLTQDQQSALLYAVYGTPAYPFVMLGLFAGLRREEILWLQWDRVHLASSPPYLEVELVVTYEGNTPIVTTELKSKAARRKIPLPPPLFHCLQSWRIQNPFNYVVPNSKGSPQSQQSVCRLWEIVESCTAGITLRWSKEEKKMLPAKRKLGSHSDKHKVTYSLDFHYTPHQLRHTYITNLCASGMDIKKIPYLAGHTTVQMTLNIYAHVVNNRPEDLFEDIAEAFSPQTLPPVLPPRTPLPPSFTP